MKSSMFSIAERRAVQKLAAYFVAAVVFAALSLSSVKHAQAQDALYSAIVVDIEPIRATGLGDFANPIGAAVKRSLNRNYAGAIDTKNKSLPVLVVEVATIYYGQEEETFISRQIFPNPIRTRDQMSGTAIVRKGKSELKRASILGSNTTPGSWPPIDDVKSGRLQALADRFAEAVRDELGD